MECSESGTNLSSCLGSSHRAFCSGTKRFKLHSWRAADGAALNARDSLCEIVWNYMRLCGTVGLPKATKR